MRWAGVKRENVGLPRGAASRVAFRNGSVEELGRETSRSRKEVCRACESRREEGGAREGRTEESSARKS